MKMDFKALDNFDFEAFARSRFYRNVLEDLERDNDSLSLGEKTLIRDLTYRHADKVFEVMGRPILLESVHKKYCFENYFKPLGFNMNHKKESY